MRLSVNIVIYFYIFICAVLLLFNLLTILRSANVKRRQKRRVQRWKTYLISAGLDMPIWSSNQLFRRLRHIQELTAFYQAIEDRAPDQPEEADAFSQENRGVVLRLAQSYGEKPAMEQAFFAYVTAACYPPVGEQRSPLAEQLLGYLDNSTVYSRENVLSALYALGNIQSIEHAFILMSQRGWYHDPRLLSDGLSRFQGDKNPLASRLWGCRSDLAECFQVGIVRFADSLTGDGFAEDFLRELEELPAETRFTLVRYFRRHAIPGAQPMLLLLLKGETEGRGELSIAAASSLASYPGGETQQALQDALRSPNWYVRQNAARSLKTLGVTWEESKGGFSCDRYATEMLEYILGVQTEEESEVPVAV
mgnify:FL=1